jgi:hypothetical protein
MRYVFKTLLTLLLVVIAAWMLNSYVDIVADNRTPEPTHNEYNFFSVVFPA